METHLLDYDIDGIVVFHVELCWCIICGYPLPVVQELDLIARMKTRVR